MLEPTSYNTRKLLVLRRSHVAMSSGKRYSGKYGDLGATVAAILLHPEARGPTLASDGSLREQLGHL